MYAELNIRVYFNKEALAEIGVTPEEALGSLRVLDNDSFDAVCVVPNPLLVPDTWDVVSGPHLLCGGNVEDRRLVAEVGEEEIP